MSTEQAYRMRLAKVTQVYEGSDGDATKALYADLAKLGPAGEVAVNLFRACKTSAAAKRYRGGLPGKGSYRDMAYSRKQYSIENLIKVLAVHAPELGIRYGWGVDRSAVASGSPHRHVFYVDTPVGQVSFHDDTRRGGPDYPAEWDGMRGLSPIRIQSWCAHLLSGYPVPPASDPISSVPWAPEPKQEGLF